MFTLRFLSFDVQYEGRDRTPRLTLRLDSEIRHDSPKYRELMVTRCHFPSLTMIELAFAFLGQTINSPYYYVVAEGWDHGWSDVPDVWWILLESRMVSLSTPDYPGGSDD
ncbi:hypothetical protein N7481_002560 [Penicillium waksmanii]|uniref:uncharacterized protein n=1 Tax=Penicillium waksmanii TaxID=69791 RepID=UPI0025475FE5|nr:uncharacterized protein N7481_002560 [Penicillium waksmanii]KAJ5995583.1 hypothetical protein N7481_002560 [Penicillium waksmanii]